MTVEPGGRGYEKAERRTPRGGDERAGIVGEEEGRGGAGRGCPYGGGCMSCQSERALSRRAWAWWGQGTGETVGLVLIFGFH
jgi:hypothetical protein